MSTVGARLALEPYNGELVFRGWKNFVEGKFVGGFFVGSKKGFFLREDLVFRRCSKRREMSSCGGNIITCGCDKYGLLVSNVIICLFIYLLFGYSGYYIFLQIWEKRILGVEVTSWRLIFEIPVLNFTYNQCFSQ